MKTDLYLDIVKCSRCNGDHKHLKFKQFKNCVSQFTHWALCPTTEEPMLTGHATISDQPQLRKFQKEGRSVTLSTKKVKA